MRRPSLAALAATAGLALAATSGFFTAKALGVGEAAAVRTVTVNIPTGSQGPAGPAGPQGPAGPASTGGGPCAGAPAAYEPGFLVINAPGGQTKIWTCLAP